MEKKIEEHWANLKWEEINSHCRTFQLNNEPALLHIIKTGFENKYMVVYEVAHEFNLSTVSLHTKKEIEEGFNIKL